ncbi:hypothetical protein [Natronosalvus caseinilyticus]|uniref:hypothetical protein n=1 Tax=Natronosalvus caseinilyticus TaxID=2953747 RepID=UPI0028AC4943|nr:hypothetical protein [Natronosalvus caseinilyticus]
MSGKTIRVPEWFHDRVAKAKRSDETMADALIRLSGGPHPEAVAGFLSEETAAEMEAAIDKKRDASIENRRDLVDSMDDSR